MHLRTTRLSDEQLIARVLAGPEIEPAFAELWSRHQPPARAHAEARGADDPDGAVARAFERALAGLGHGALASWGFRAHLLIAVEEGLVEGPARDGGPVHGTAPAPGATSLVRPRASGASARALKATATMRAFAVLPGSLQSLLWYREVEELSDGPTARYLGIAPGAVEGSTTTALRSFRHAWISAQLLDPALDDDCRASALRLAGDVFGAGSPEHVLEAVEHIRCCLRCAIIEAELDRVNEHLADVLLGALLGVEGGRVYRALVQRRPSRHDAEVPVHDRARCTVRRRTAVRPR